MAIAICYVSGVTTQVSACEPFRIVADEVFANLRGWPRPSTLTKGCDWYLFGVAEKLSLVYSYRCTS